MSAPSASWVAEHTFLETLADGEAVTVRPILPDDKQALRAGMAALSRESRRFRFFSAVEQLTEQQLAYFTEIDYDDHFAWVAIAGDPASRAARGIGVARYIRDRTDPQSSEWAIVVIDEYQRRGVGTVLLRHLARSARTHGIRHFLATVLAENDPMLDVARGLGGRTRFIGDGLVEVDVELPPADVDLRSTAAYRMFRGAVTQRGRAHDGPTDGSRGV